MRASARRAAARAHSAWLREAAAALRASRDVALRLDHGGSRSELALIRLRIDHALLELEFLMGRVGPH